MCGVGLLQTSTAMTCITSQSCCGGSGEYDIGSFNRDAEGESNADSQYTKDSDTNTNIAKGSTNIRDDTDTIPTTGGGTGTAGGSGATKDTQDKNDAKDVDKYKNDVPDYNAESAGTCLASKSGCYFPSVCCSGVCLYGMTSNIGMCQ
jgi:hypothetical protein